MNNISRQIVMWMNDDLKLKCSVVICKKLERCKSSVHKRLTDLLKYGKIF